MVHSKSQPVLACAILSFLAAANATWSAVCRIEVVCIAVM